MNDADARKAPLPARLSWSSHPARREPAKTVFAAGVIGLMAASATMWAGPFLGALALFVLLASTAGFLLPVRYEIGEDHLRVVTTFGGQTRPWSALRRADVGARGLHLSPFRSRSLLDGTRGVYLRFEDNREAVVAAVSERLEAVHGAAGLDASTGLRGTPAGSERAASPVSPARSEARVDESLGLRGEA